MRMIIGAIIISALMGNAAMARQADGAQCNGRPAVIADKVMPADDMPSPNAGATGFASACSEQRPGLVARACAGSAKIKGSQGFLLKVSHAPLFR